MSIQFGVGALYTTQLQDAAGNAIANPTPIQFATLQEVGVDMSFDAKTLYGQKQFPLAVGRGKGKIACKAKLADIDGRVLSDLVFGQSSSAGIRMTVNNFAAAIPATPFQVTIAPPNAGTYTEDLGVIDAGTGLPMKRVASAPATGEYSVTVATGVYTFASADTGKAILISYAYSATSTTAKYGKFSNQFMGYAPFFSVTLQNDYAGSSLMLKFNRCMSSKFSFPFKNEDFTMPDFEFEVMADAAGDIGTWAQK